MKADIIIVNVESVNTTVLSIDKIPHRGIRVELSIGIYPVDIALGQHIPEGDIRTIYSKLPYLRVIGGRCLVGTKNCMVDCVLGQILAVVALDQVITRIKRKRMPYSKKEQGNGY